MYKLLDTASFFSHQKLLEPQIKVIDFNNLGELVKEAADERISAFVNEIKPQAGKIYLHINAMGAGEYWSANKNGDWFPEENLKQYYKTFETSPAHVFRHHINKDPAKAIGKVLLAIYNDRMHRVELVAEVDKSLGSDIEDRISMGDFPLTSMACKTPYDVCSICGNKAHTRQDYCTHLRSDLGQLLPDGRRVMALNVGPLKFFDISIVIRPADVTSGILQKVASEEVVGSAELAELEEIGETKQASFRKLADIIKEVTGTVDGISPELDKILFKTKDLDKGLISQLRVFNLSDTLHTLADLGISPSIEFLSELIARKVLGDQGRGLGKIIADYITSVEPETTNIPTIHFEKPQRFNILVAKLLAPHLESSSLLPEYVEKRASLGYSSFNPNAYEEPTKPQPKEPHGPGLPQTLLAIGGVALLAKIFISELIKERLRAKFSNSNNINAKIVLVKQASDYLVAFKLSKFATAKEFKKDRKNLDDLASQAKFVLKGTNTELGGKLSKIIKTVQVGSKAVDKYSKGN
jgi:hypothetical protein